MNTKNIFTHIINLGILSSILIFGITLTGIKANASDTNIQYPIAELGNCQSKDACKTYCDKSANTASCIAFAEKNNLMSFEEINAAKKFLNAGGKGPGGCTSKDLCESYCDDISHINECIAFAEKSGILSPAELAEAKQVQAAIAKGIQPPPCGNKKACDSYCNEPGNMKVCISFAEAAGFLSGKELEEAKKMISAIDKGAVPLPCRGKEECDAYCSQPGNMEACITFSVAAGFMSEKDAEMARKTGGRGPDGCKSKEECDAFCGKQENQETCFNFGRDNGMISPEQLKEMEEGNKKFNESINNAPPEVKQCLVSVFGDLSKVYPSRENGEKMMKCYQEFMGPEGSGGPMGPGSQSGPGGSNNVGGPGGCQSPQECDAYCQTHQEECKNFGPGPTQPGQMPGGQPPQNFQQPMPQEQINPMISPSEPQPGTAPQTTPGSFVPPPPPAPAPAPESAPAPQSLNSNNIELLSRLFLKAVANVFFSLNPLINIGR